MTTISNSNNKKNIWTIFCVAEYDALEFDVTYDLDHDTYTLMAHFHRNMIDEDAESNELSHAQAVVATDSEIVVSTATEDDDQDLDNIEIISNGHTIFLNTTTDSLEEMSVKINQMIESSIFDGINILSMGVIFNTDGEQVGEVNWQDISDSLFGPLDDDDDDDDDKDFEEFDLASGQVKGIVLEDHISDNPLHAKPVKTLQ